MLEIGKKFYSSVDSDRIKLQTEYKQIYLSQHIWNKIVTRDGASQDIDPLVPIAATISEISSDLIFGEPPALDFNNDGTQEKVRMYFKERADMGHDFKVETLEASVYTSALGMVLWYVFVKDGKTYWKFKEPQKAVWESDFFGLTMVRFFDLVDDDTKSSTFEVQEFEKKDGKIIFRHLEVVVAKDDWKVKSIYELQPEGVIPELDTIPVIPVYNVKYMNEFLGKSDYEGKQQIFAEIDNRVDQINSVLQDHSDPWVFLPAGILDQYGRFNRSSGKWIEKSIASSNTENSVDFTTWDASLGAAFQQIEWLIKLAYGTSRIAPSLSPFADLSGGNSESGRSLKHRAVTTIAMINRKRVYWTQAIKAFFAIVKKLDGEMKDINIDDLNIVWSDGLPTDEEALVSMTVQKVNAGILSKLTAIEQTEEIDRAKAQEELTQIEKEATTQAEIQSTATGPLTF